MKQPRVHLLLGPETGQKSEFLDSLKGQLAAKFKEQPEEHRFYAFETRTPDILSLLRNHSLFAAHRIVILSNVEEIKKKDEIASLVEYCASPSPDATLVLVSDQISVDTKIEKAVGAGKKVFWELFQNQKTSWITDFFRNRRIRINRDAVELLLEMVENDTQDLRKECEKLSVFFPEGSQIGQEDIEKYLYHSKEENVFTLFETVVTLEFQSSIEILNRILLSKEANAVALLAGLLWQWRRLLSFKELLEDRYGRDEAFSALGMRSKRQQGIYGRAERNFTSAELRNIVDLTVEHDILVRSTRSDIHPHLLQLYLYSVIKRKGEKKEAPVL